MSTGASLSRFRLILLRGLIWSLIGAIYAPLFAGLRVFFEDCGLGPWAVVPAASVAGGIGAAFYGARQVALAATALGLAVTAAVFFVVSETIELWRVVLLAGLVGAILGGIARFPDRCSLAVPGKALAGLVMGALTAVVLVVAEYLHHRQFHISVIAAFLVSTNGILYVATVQWWTNRVARVPRQACNGIEAAVIATLAGVSAGSLWLVAGPFIGVVDSAMLDLTHRIAVDIPLALGGGMLGGAVSGTLLEAFRFPWALD